MVQQINVVLIHWDWGLGLLIGIGHWNWGFGLGIRIGNLDWDWDHESELGIWISD